MIRSTLELLRRVVVEKLAGRRAVTAAKVEACDGDATERASRDNAGFDNERARDRAVLADCQRRSGDRALDIELRFRDRSADTDVACRENREFIGAVGICVDAKARSGGVEVDTRLVACGSEVERAAGEIERSPSLG